MISKINDSNENTFTIKTIERITKEIFDIIEETDCSAMDAIVAYSEKNNFEIEVVGSYVTKSPKLLSMIEEEAAVLNLLKEKNSALPI